MKNSIPFAILFSVVVSLSAHAQETDSLSKIEVSGKQESLDSSPFPLLPLAELPFSANKIEKEELEDAQVKRLSDVTRIDASVSDSYNANGYWDFLNIRGFTLDNRFSYLREGLPINAETSIPVDNKSSIEVLKGLSGIQVGASSPGGMVNFAVNRPPALGDFRKILSSVNDEGGYLLGADMGRHGKQNGYRATVVYEDLKPPIDHSQGYRYLASYAQDFYLSETTLLQFEIENSQRSQPSQAGMSLLGNRLPDPRPQVNLNNQPWTTPVVFGATTGTVGVSHRLNSQFQGSVLIGFQDLVTDDRLAYPFGCTAENAFDRYCSDGTFDVYDFRSNNERRRTEAAKLSFDWNGTTGLVTHNLQFGVLASRGRDRFEKQAYNYVGVGNVEGSTVLPEDSALNDENTNRGSDIVDVFAYDSLKLSSWTLWIGVRSSSIDRSSVRTDGSRPTDYNKNFVLPWAALSYDFAKAMVYASYGEGVETFVTPNRNTYTNPGQFVDDVRSRQVEIGVRALDGKSWSLAAFEIHRPVVVDQAPLYQVDGEALHRGLEAQGQIDVDRWNLGASAMLLEAKREDSKVQPELNGLRPVNVPKSLWRAFANYQWSKDLNLNARFSLEDNRAVTQDNSILLSSWNRWDLGASYLWALGDGNLKAQLFVENVLDTKFWKESPTQYGHIYLYPGQERTWTLNLAYSF